MKRLRSWLKRNTSRTGVGDSILTGVAALLGALAGVSLALWWFG